MKTFIGRIVPAIVVIFSVSSVYADGPASSYTLQKTLQISGEGRWDYVTFDSDSQHLYVTRSTHTQVINVADGKVLADIKGQKGAHGTAIATAAGRGFISDGKDASIVIFDLKTNEVLGNAVAAEDCDGIIFDSGTNRVLAGCGDAGKLAVLAPDADPKSAKADTVDLGGKPEFLAADGQGKAYVNLNDKDQIAVVDIKALKVVASWPTAPGSKPTGLTIDPAHHHLFVGCRNQKMIMMNTEDGKVLADLPIGKGNDACAFNPNTGEAFASCGDATITDIKETSPGKFEASTITTKTGARTMAIDPATNMMYLPTAEFEAATAGARRPAMKPGTFMILVVGPVSKG
jgi:DNA-binding beta-propeller fold protein YncE